MRHHDPGLLQATMADEVWANAGRQMALLVSVCHRQGADLTRWNRMQATWQAVPRAW